MLAADIKLQILFETKVLKHTCLDDFPVCLACNKHGILINDQLFYTATDLAERPIDRPAGILSIKLVVLSVHQEIAAVTQ